jgi:hypothetical protein
VEVGTALGAAFTSGLNLYATVALLGIAGRWEWADTPDALQHWWVIAIALGMFAIEFVVDKIPWLDSTWDSVHTFIRPSGAAVLSGMIGGQIDDVSTGALVAVGAVLGLSSHGAKATTRMLANTSPEPFSNIALSIAEDSIVVAVMWLALERPRIAAGVAVVLGVLCVILTIVLWRAARRAWRRLRTRSPARA